MDGLLIYFCIVVVLSCIMQGLLENNGDAEMKTQNQYDGPFLDFRGG